jgi:ribose transport system substrate-binding protein
MGGNKMKKILSIMLTLVLVFSLSACSSTKDTSETSNTDSTTTDSTTTDSTAAEATQAPASTDASADGYTIGFSVYDLSNEYFQSMLEGIQAEADAQGVKLIVHDQKSDENELVTGCNNLLDQGVDALVVSPCKPEVMGNIVDAAHEKNIPVIILDIGDGGSDKDAIVVSDMFGGGQIAGKYALDLLTQNGVQGKEYAIIKCEESATYAIQRGQGFENVMSGAGYTKVKEITANSDTTEAYTAMQDILASNPDIVAVFCENDNMALGASSAIDEAGKTGQILVFGFDGNASAVTAIQDGKMAGTIAQQPKEIGALGVTLSLQAIKGEALSYDNADNKEIYADVYLIDNTGNRNDNYKAE